MKDAVLVFEILPLMLDTIFEIGFLCFFLWCPELDEV